MSWYQRMYEEKMNKWFAIEANLPKVLKGWVIKVIDPESLATTKGFCFSASKVINEEYGDTAGMRIVMQQYSACCAFEQLNYFTYSQSAVTEAEVHAFIDLCNQMMRSNYTSRWATRIVLNTVQKPSLRYSHDTDPEKLLKDKGNLQYPFVHSWAMKQKSVIDTPIVNHNTGNIIHHLIVNQL